MTSCISTSTTHSFCHHGSMTQNMSNSGILICGYNFPNFHISCSTSPAITLGRTLQSMVLSNILANALQFSAPLDFCCTTWENTNPDVPTICFFHVFPIYLSLEKVTQQSNLCHSKFMVINLKLILNTTWNSFWMI